MVGTPVEVQESEVQIAKQTSQRHRGHFNATVELVVIAFCRTKSAVHFLHLSFHPFLPSEALWAECHLEPDEDRRVKHAVKQGMLRE